MHDGRGFVLECIPIRTASTAPTRTSSTCRVTADDNNTLLLCVCGCASCVTLSAGDRTGAPRTVRANRVSHRVEDSVYNQPIASRQ